MAVLEKLRGWGIFLSILVALPLLLFIIDPSQIIQTVQSVSSRYDVGKIAGKSVSYADFQQAVEQYSRISEQLSGNSASSEQQQQQIRNAAWQSLVDKYLFTKKAADAGIKVGEEELKELLAGDMVSPVISQNPVFQDENGNFSKTALQNIINAVQTDQTGRLKTYWDYIQNTVFTQQFYAKYGSLFSASNFQNPLMLKRAIADNNNTANVDFVLVPSVFTQDSTITVSDEEVQKYYNDHKSLYRQNASRDMEYVVFEVTPSAADIEATKEAMNSIYDEFSTTEAVKTFLARNSEKPLSEYWYRAGELNTINTDLNEFVFSNASGTSPIVSDNENVFYAGRIMATAQVPDSIYVRHILFAATDSQEKIDSVMNVLQKGESFANVATSVSADTQSAADGGQDNIGWLTQSYMIPGFEPALTAQVGKPFVLKTQYGTHIVEVTKRTAPVTKKQVAILQKSSLSSNETFNDYYSQASKFAKLAAGDYKNYKAAVDTLGVYSHPMTAVQESNDTYGSINQAREVTRWIFDNKVGKVSDIITVNNNYFFIATVTGIHKDGIATLDETKDVIRQQLFAQKAAEKAAADVAEQIKGMDDLQEIADKLNTSVSSDVDVRFASLNGQGLDPKFIGAVSVAPEGKICGPVAGMIGTYVFKVNGRDTGAFYTEDDAKANADQMASYMSQMILPVMMLDADVKDNRARFF